MKKIKMLKTDRFHRSSTSLIKTTMQYHCITIFLIDQLYNELNYSLTWKFHKNFTCMQTTEKISPPSTFF
jgi:hypothetical protein